MDQSTSLQDRDEVWLAKLAMLGFTVDHFGGYWFTYLDGRVKVCGLSLPGVAKEIIGNMQKGLYQ